MRAADAWLRSTCWQNRRSTRLTEDLDCYGERLAPAAALDDIVAEVAKAARPHLPLVVALEGSRSLAQGPLSPLLDLVELDRGVRACLRFQPPDNAQ